MAQGCSRVLVIFRRDLRLEDNTALLAAQKDSKEVLPCFVFDPRQVQPHLYYSPAAAQCMIDSLRDLDRELMQRAGKLNLFYGKPEEILDTLITQEHIDALYYNRDYTPFSQERDAAIAALCRKRALPWYAFDDALLQPPGQVVKKDGSPYTVFTPFFRKASSLPVAGPRPLPATRFVRAQGALTWEALFQRIGIEPRGHPLGGRSQAVKILERLRDFSVYEDTRDYPFLEMTTGLSPHLKFGTCSVREVYQHIGQLLSAQHSLIRQLYWRDFFTHILFHFPRVLGEAFRPEFQNISWENDEKKFLAWCEGRTGFPIVDAGMRQLVESGFMHNRLRMITASFLVKDLHIDWRWGERFFATRLADYDPAVNNGNWQWAASTGCDAQPYFRIFNPWLQQKKFDEDCRYIQRWIPELRGLPARAIHAWAEQRMGSAHSYPAPIVDHGERAVKIQRLFEEARQQR